MTDNTKMREEFEKWAEGEDMPITQWEIEKHKGEYWNDFTQSAWRAWQAAQSPAVPVVERNQCDGCNRGLQVCDDGLHREPSGHPVMACTRNKYTHSITAAELERLRKDVERYRWLRNYEKFNYRVHRAVQIGGNEMDEAIDAAMQERKE